MWKVSHPTGVCREEKVIHRVDNFLSGGLPNELPTF